MDTKKSLKVLHAAPIRAEYDTPEAYIDAKNLWIESNSEVYQDILMAPISEEDGNE